MKKSFETDLYNRVFDEINKIKMIDCHEHLESEKDFPKNKNIHIGRFFIHYASSDLVSAGMPLSDMGKIQTDSTLTPKERWKLLEPWYKKSYNTAYCESLRIALQDIYDIEDFSSSSVDLLTERMKNEIKPGFTRKVFNKANIDYAMNNPFGPDPVYNPDPSFDCFLCDMVDDFTVFNIDALKQQSNMDILSLDDYLQVIDFYFERDASSAGAFKVGRAYDRTLLWEDATQSSVEKSFNRLLDFNDQPDKKEIQQLENFIIHYLCRKCGEYDLRIKFHTGIQEGYGNIIRNSRAALLNNLFLKYPKTKFDIYHISYPYQEELAVLAKNFANVTVDFCWMWVINQSAGRRALSDMLDSVPANKIHGFGGDYIFVEGSYGHARITRQEISRVLCEKIEEGRFTEDYALKVGNMLLRDNAIENFDLIKRRQTCKERLGI